MSLEFGEIEKTQAEQKSYEETQIEWKIRDFLSVAPSRIFVESRKFSAGDGSSLRLRLHPNVTFDYGPIGLRLHREEIVKYAVSREYKVEFKCGFKRSSGSVLNFVTGIIGASEYMGDYIQTIQLSELQSRKSELIPGNVLTVTCTLRREIIHHTQSIGSNETKSLKLIKLIKLDTLSENFGKIFADKETCDTTLKVQDKEYKAHRAVLTARSPVFAATFKHDTSERKTGIITIPDCDAHSFHKFLEFLYTGKLEDISCRNAFHLYVTSDKYDVQELKAFCVQYLMQCLTEENVCEMVAFADKYDETELLSAVQKFFNKNAPKIFITSEWESFLKKDNRLANKLLIGMSKVKF